MSLMINSKIKALFIPILISFTSFAAVAESKNSHLAPLATIDEAKIKHWRMPEIGRRFWDIPVLENSFIDASPEETSDGIPVGELGVDGGNKEIIFKLAQEIADGRHGQFDSLLLLHKGKLLFESYYLRGRIDLPHPQSSVTKVYTALALGRAIELGYLSLADLNKPLVYFLKNLEPSKFTKGAEKITLHQALTMTTGIRISDQSWEKMRENPIRLKGQKEVQALLEYSTPITAQTQIFHYDIGPQLVMQVIEAVVPETAKEFIKNELFDKMGITNFDWQTAVSGLPESIWKASLISRDMVKIGILATNKGKWNGKQLVSESFVTKAISKISTTGDDDIFGGGKDVSNQGYGYYWWSSDLKYDNNSYFSISAQGGGGMYIVLIEELDLVVVVTAHNSQDTTQQMIAERILPAFVQ